MIFSNYSTGESCTDPLAKGSICQEYICIRKKTCINSQPVIAYCPLSPRAWYHIYDRTNNKDVSALTTHLQHGMLSSSDRNLPPPFWFVGIKVWGNHLHLKFVLQEAFRISAVPERVISIKPNAAFLFSPLALWSDFIHNSVGKARYWHTQKRLLLKGGVFWSVEWRSKPSRDSLLYSCMPYKIFPYQIPGFQNIFPCKNMKCWNVLKLVVKVLSVPYFTWYTFSTVERHGHDP